MPILAHAIRLASAQRPNFFTGRLLSAEDLQAEQDYHRHQRWLHNRLLHGAGVVTGLSVTLAGGRVRVAPGCALDCLGREIVVPAPAELALPIHNPHRLLCVQYAERGLHPMPTHDDTLLDEDSVNQALTEETYTLVWCGAPLPHARHGHGWQACGDEHSVPLARVVRAQGRWRRDPKYRRPTLA